MFFQAIHNTTTALDVYYHYGNVSALFWSLISRKYYNFWPIAVSVRDEVFVIFDKSFKGDNGSFSKAPVDPIVFFIILGRGYKVWGLDSFINAPMMAVVVATDLWVTVELWLAGSLIFLVSMAFIATMFTIFDH